MTRKQAIKEFKREGMIIPESAVELAISDMEKIEKIGQIVNKWISLEERPNFCMMEIREILEQE